MLPLIPPPRRPSLSEEEFYALGGTFSAWQAQLRRIWRWRAAPWRQPAPKQKAAPEGAAQRRSGAADQF